MAVLLPTMFDHIGSDLLLRPALTWLARIAQHSPAELLSSIPRRLQPRAGVGRNK